MTALDRVISALKDVDFHTDGERVSVTMVLERILEDAVAEERAACVAIAREVVDKWDFASTLVNADGVLAANEILHRIENRGRTHPAEWWTP